MSKGNIRKRGRSCLIAVAALLGALLVGVFFLAFIGFLLEPPTTPTQKHAPVQDTLTAELDTVIDSTALPMALPLALPVAQPETIPEAVEAPPPHQAPERVEVTVYTTTTGQKYHRAGCSSLRRSRYATSLTQAKAAGYTPCYRCHPPR